MENKFKILFIDDELLGENSRKQLVESLNRDPRFEVEAHHPVNILKIINEGSLDDKYTLIIVDYKLNGNANELGQFCVNNGYSFTSIFKEKFPGTPVYLISQILEDDISLGEHYDKMLSHHILTKEIGRNLLASDCADYSALKDRVFYLGSAEDIADFLSVPIDSVEDFKKSLPLEFRDGLTNASEINTAEVIDKEASHIRFAKWINSYLLTKSGPLINLDELAVLFGVELEYFKKEVLERFKKEMKVFEYNGVFASSNEKLWWTQSVFNYVVNLLGLEATSTPWEKIPQHLGIDNSHWAKCCVCKDYYPECIAYDSDDKKLSVKLPAHWRCTTVSESYDIPAGFSPIFILDEE
ncbi:hypothetical protein N4S66_18560 [Shewanella algae]|uniref:Response regulator n=1 Tax=bacterium 19NY03SH02 TaxID=2920631 RepID=A0AAU6V534_UNCXX|nr:hypothetical protein [Shewanella algae]MCT8982457.1 hypothetical protein [Shewanella algae]